MGADVFIAGTFRRHGFVLKAPKKALAMPCLKATRGYCGEYLVVQACLSAVDECIGLLSTADLHPDGAGKTMSERLGQASGTPGAVSGGSDTDSPALTAARYTVSFEGAMCTGSFLFPGHQMPEVGDTIRLPVEGHGT
jgi:hypothetical protein